MVLDPYGTGPCRALRTGALSEDDGPFIHDDGMEPGSEKGDVSNAVADLAKRWREKPTYWLRAEEWCPRDLRRAKGAVSTMPATM